MVVAEDRHHFKQPKSSLNLKEAIVQVSNTYYLRRGELRATDMARRPFRLAKVQRQSL